MKAIFGPAGNSLSFRENQNKKNLLEYLNGFGLKAYEYQCGMGVRISKEKAKKLGCLLKGIQISVHSPYYISISSVEKEKRDKSIDYILKTAEIAKEMNAKRIVIHSGSCRNLERETALEFAKKTLEKAYIELKASGFFEIFMCLETMGKINQLGTLEEVIALCKISENFIPCVDFGHLNARSFGSIKSKKEYNEILNEIENSLGSERLKNLHIHFSKIEYTEPGGEKKHLTFKDSFYGPPYEPLIELIVKKNLTPTVICESAGTQAEDASEMKEYYEKLLGDKILGGYLEK